MDLDEINDLAMRVVAAMEPMDDEEERMSSSILCVFFGGLYLLF